MEVDSKNEALGDASMMEELQMFVLLLVLDSLKTLYTVTSFFLVLPFACHSGLISYPT